MCQLHRETPNIDAVMHQRSRALKRNLEWSELRLLGTKKRSQSNFSVTETGMGGVYILNLKREETPMRPLSIITLLIGFLLVPVNAICQESSTQRRTQEIVASFNKEKHAVKEKYGVRTEKYKKVVSEPAIKQNIRDYSGVYEVDGFGYLINIQVGNDDSVKATGSEPANGSTRQRRFRLEGAKIVSAMLTGTKVYDDGATEKFEGVFINRTDFISPTDKGVSSFGLGVVGNSVEVAGVTLDKLFYQLKQ
jgi:hypothetical protein